MGTYGSTCVDMDQYGCICVHMGHIGSYGSIYVHMGPCRSHMGPYGHIWVHIGPYGSKRVHGQAQAGQAGNGWLGWQKATVASGLDLRLSMNQHRRGHLRCAKLNIIIQHFKIREDHMNLFEFRSCFPDSRGEILEWQLPF